MPLSELQRKLGDSHLSPNLGLLVPLQAASRLSTVAKRSGPYYLGVGTISDSPSLWEVIHTSQDVIEE